MKTKDGSDLTWTLIWTLISLTIIGLILFIVGMIGYIVFKINIGDPAYKTDLKIIDVFLIIWIVGSFLILPSIWWIPVYVIKKRQSKALQKWKEKYEKN